MSQLTAAPTELQEAQEAQRAKAAAQGPIAEDRELIERFLRRGLTETPDFHAFWGYFVGALTRDLNCVPDEDPALTT
ncbi:MAG: hypothetical protein ACRD5K_18030, partial [Candidatus Acidiferrales bacterium]